jgi:L-threonylcarbamoyladenylate synthase
MKKVDWKEAGQLLKAGKIGVIPTDTIYGISSLASREDLIEEIYEIKKRDRNKPFIFLIGEISDLERFGIILDAEKKKTLKKFWPGRVSLVFSCPGKKFECLHRGSRTLAFRMPEDNNLLSLLKKTGPLVSTSVNIEGEPYAKNISEAEKFFGDRLDFAIDEGNLEGSPSTVIDFSDERVRFLRRGSWKIEDHFNLAHWKNILKKARR